MISRNIEIEVVNDDKLKKTYEKARKIISSIIKPNMNELKKEKAIHDYVVNNVKYDLGALRKYFSDEELSKMYGKSYNKSEYDNENYNEEDCYTYYGALINGRAVCEGYMEVTKLLMNRAGI